jgi:nudix-type nucleoside diphosphatase (YffH/AdpP family)
LGCAVQWRRLPAAADGTPPNHGQAQPALDPHRSQRICSACATPAPDPTPQPPMKKVTLQSKHRVFDGFFKIDEAVLRYERFDGRMSEPVQRLCLERGDSVAAIVFDPAARRAIFTRQFRYPAYEKGPGWLVETIAGMIDDGETPEAALRRELLEELGYEAGAVEPIANFYLSPGGSSERIWLYYTEVSDARRSGAGGGLAAEGEDIETVSMSIDELRPLLHSGGLHDAKTIIGVQWLLNRLNPTPEE